MKARALRWAALLALTLCLAAPARAVNYQDMWWNPAESGWGLNLTQQGDTVFAIWFVYDTGGRDTWFVAVCTLVDDRSCHGDLSVTTGPVYSALQFDPRRVTETVVGSATFTFADANHGTLAYTVSGVGVSKSIVRFSYVPPPLAGTYWIAGSGLAQACGSSGDFAYRFENAGLVLATSGSQLDLAFKLYNEADWNARYQCNATGAYTHWGSQIAFSAPFSCSDGSSGTLSLPDFNVTERGLAGTLRWSYGTCVETDHVAGVRHPATPTTAPGSIVLGATAFTVAEGGGTVAVTVARTGGTSGRVTVAYATADGTARAGQDYTAVAGTLVFEDGDATPRVIAIPILADTAVEGTETFGIVLSAPTGGASLGTPSTGTVTIVDDDTATGGTVVGTGGGTVTFGDLAVTIPAGAAVANVGVAIASATPDTAFTSGATLVTDAFRVELTGELKAPISLSFAGKSAPGAGDLALAAIVDDNFLSTYHEGPHRDAQFVEAAYANGRYTVVLPVTYPVATPQPKALTARAGASSSSFTIYIFTGNAMRSTTHFNMRYPARGCNSLVIDQWLQYAEEAYARLVPQIGFDPIGMAMPATRLTIDVEPNLKDWQGNPVDGYLSWHVWTLGLFNNLVIEMKLSSQRCNSFTADDMTQMEVTIGHEFFHGIQNTYDPAHAVLKSIWGDRGKCLYEASSSWFEGEMLDVKGYMSNATNASVNNQSFYQKGLGHGCATDSRWYGYGMGTFLRHLTEKYGREIVLSFWRNILSGPGYGVPIDAMLSANLRVTDEWQAFVEKLLLGTSGFGWPVPPADAKLDYAPGQTMRVADSMRQLAARKYRLDFSALAGSAAAPPVCRVRLNQGAGKYAVVLYSDTARLADVDKDFTPQANGKYWLIVTNVVDTALVVDGIRYGDQAPYEVVVDCGEPSPCRTGNWEFSVSPVPSMEAFSCKLGPDSQTARLCITATNGVVSARGSTCYSRLQSASGSIGADGKFSVSFKWGGYNTSSLDGSGDSGEVVSGTFTGTMTAGCVMSGPVSGEYHAWSKSSSWCANGYDIKQGYQATGSSR